MASVHGLSLKSVLEIIDVLVFADNNATIAKNKRSLFKSYANAVQKNWHEYKSKQVISNSIV